MRFACVWLLKSNRKVGADMRDFAKVAPSFWIGDTGRMLRKLGAEVQVAAFYLITAPGANMTGIYYLPMPTFCHETGPSPEGASKALRSLSEGGFAHYDPHSETGLGGRNGPFSDR